MHNCLDCKADLTRRLNEAVFKSKYHCFRVSESSIVFKSEAKRSIRERYDTKNIDLSQIKPFPFGFNTNIAYLKSLATILKYGLIEWNAFIETLYLQPKPYLQSRILHLPSKISLSLNSPDFFHIDFLHTYTYFN